MCDLVKKTAARLPASKLLYRGRKFSVGPSVQFCAPLSLFSYLTSFFCNSKRLKRIIQLLYGRFLCTGAGPLSLNRAGSINAPSRPRTLRSQPRRGCASKKRSRSLTITRPSGSIPKDAGAFFNCGVASLTKGSVADAQADFAQANELNPKYPYAALWLDIAERRNRLPSGLAELSAKLDMTAWPAPVVRHFMGEIDLAALLAAASDPDPVKAKGQLCEARFLAASECPKNFTERRAANAELRTLGATA
jgi:hypothetical protein